MSAPRIPIEDRIHGKYVVDAATGCWNWQAAISRGYGYIAVDRRGRVAHRVMYELLVGKVPDGTELDHLCRNRRCVNPAHLEPVSHRVNVWRGAGLAAANARATHCIRGHAFDEANTRIRANGSRYCRACERARYAASKPEHGQEAA